MRKKTRVCNAAKNSWTWCLAKRVDSHCYQAGINTTINQEKYTTYIERNTVKCKQQTVWFAAQLSRCCHAPPVNSQPLFSDWVAVVCLFDIFATSIKSVKTFLRILVNRLCGTRTVQNCSQRQLFPGSQSSEFRILKTWNVSFVSPPNIFQQTTAFNKVWIPNQIENDNTILIVIAKYGLLRPWRYHLRRSIVIMSNTNLMCKKLYNKLSYPRRIFLHTQSVQSIQHANGKVFFSTIAECTKYSALQPTHTVVAFWETRPKYRDDLAKALHPDILEPTKVICQNHPKGTCSDIVKRL